MNITVDCPCGNPFNFQEDPVNGRLQYPVTCPNCGKDGTALANEYIGRVVRGEDVGPKKPSWLSTLFGAQKQRFDHADFQDSPASKSSESEPEAAGGKSARFAVGVAVIALTGIAGALGWYWIAMKTGFYFGILAWVIGALVGLAGRFAMPNGSYHLASLAGGCAFAAILAGHVLVTKMEVDQTIKKHLELVYLANYEAARMSENLKTDAEVRAFLADYPPNSFSAARLERAASGSGEPLTLPQQRALDSMGYALMGVMDRAETISMTMKDLLKKRQASEITAAEIAEFKTQWQAPLKDMMRETPPKAEWKAGVARAVQARIHFNNLITQSIGPHTIAWTLFGLLTAFKLAYNKSETEDV